jgi:hypothetical protein
MGVVPFPLPLCLRACAQQPTTQVCTPLRAALAGDGRGMVVERWAAA